LQQACEIAQILESHRIRTCELLPALATAGSPEMFQKALGEMLNDNYRLTSLALLITSNDDEGVKMWIDTNRKRSFALIKVAPIEKNVLAEITRARSFEEKKEALEAATSQVEETMRPHISSFASPFSYKGFRFLSSWDTGLPTEHWALGAEWGGAVGKMSPWRRKHPE